MSIGILVDVGQSFTSIEQLSSLVSIDLDVTISEAHEWANDVTNNPVENGAPITDHIQPLPDKLSITGSISDSAISDVAIEEFNSTGGFGFLDRVDTHIDLLYELKERRETVSVYTKHKVYNDMAISSISIPRRAGLGDSVEFNIEFTNIKIVSNQTVEIPNGIGTKKINKSVTNKSQPKKNAGKQQPKTTNKVNEKNQSILSGIFS